MNLTFLQNGTEILNFTMPILLIGCSFCLAVYLYNYRKQQDYAYRSNVIKTYLLEKIGYEMRNPLNGIIGFSEMLSAGHFGDLNYKQRERIKDIMKCGANIQSILTNVVDLTHSKTASIELSENVFEVVESVCGVEEALKTKIEANNAKIIKFFSNEKLKIRADKNKFNYVVNIILDNAIHYSKNGSQITIKQELDDNKNYVLSILDSGKGMSLEERAILFNLPETDYKNIGMRRISLGMPLAKLIMELHGGTIEVESELGAGTSVKLIIPKNRVVQKSRRK